jgi:hypothetical protein
MTARIVSANAGFDFLGVHFRKQRKLREAEDEIARLRQLERLRCTYNAQPCTKFPPGDLLVVTLLDRQARSTRDLLNVLATNTRINDK